MKTLMFRKLAMVATIFGASAMGCGDGLKCPEDVRIVIDPILSEISAADDIDAAQPGIQINISVSTNMVAGSDVDLTISTLGAVTNRSAKTDEDGRATFEAVSLSAGTVTLTASGTSSCGSAESDPEVTEVVSDTNCSLVIRENPIEIDFYAPIPVLNTSNDSDPDAVNFQANLDVSADDGAEVKVFLLDIQSGGEQEIASTTAMNGSAEIAATLMQGQNSLRATCTTGPLSGISATTTVFVDTLAPTCSLITPEEGVAITPDFDTDGDPDNGIQFTWTGNVDGGASGDVLGEPGIFYRENLEVPGTTVDAAGNSNSVDPGEFSSPGLFNVRFQGQDHAENTCIDDFDVQVVLSGCTVMLQSPNSIVNTDSDGNNITGLQTDVVALIGMECAGQSATADCGLGPISVVVPADGLTTFPDVSLSNMSTVEGSTLCEVTVTNLQNFTTSDSASVAFDTASPVAQLQFINPSNLSCGTSIPNDGTVDLDGDFSNGIQVAVNVVAPFSEIRNIELTNSGACTGTCVTEQVGAQVIITLDPGNNDIRAVGIDAAGNVGRSAPCNIPVADIAVSFDSPVSEGLAGTPDDEIPGGDLDLTICGDVSVASSTVTVTIDNGTPLPATVDGAGNWCLNAPVSLPDGIYNITVDATAPPDVGTNFTTLVVDTVSPNSPTDLTGFVLDRANLRVTWTAPSDENGNTVSSYIVKYLEGSNFTEFATEGTIVSILFPPSPPGSTESIDLNGVFAGTDYYIGVVALDGAGNESIVATFGPLTPEFDRTGSVVPPDANDGDDKSFGYQTSGGDYNDDGFSDIAVSAAIKTLNGSNAVGAVYVYFGSATGIDFSTPSVTIEGTSPEGQFGNGITRINWDGVGGDDLAIGAPFEDAFNGGVYIYSSTTLSAGGVITAANADATITVATAANALTSGGLGFTLAAGELNAVGSREDLIISAPNSNVGQGGIIVVYGGSTNSIVLSTNPADAEMNGAGAHYFENPEPMVTFGVFGAKLEYLGDTRAGGGPGDIGIAPHADNIPDGMDDYMIVLRGRTTVPTNTISTITLDADDLRINYSDSDADGSTYFADDMAGIESADGFRDVVITGLAADEGHVWIVDGSLTGAVTIDQTSGFLTWIEGGAFLPIFDIFGSAVANPAGRVSGDINADDQDDLIVAGGHTGDTSLFVWYGGNIPTGITDSDSADYVIAAQPEFLAINSFGQRSALEINWVGDINGDGLSDLCFADWEARGDDGAVSYETDGRIELFWDEQL